MAPSKRSLTKYNPKLHGINYPWSTASPTDVYSAKCRYCQKDVYIGSMGASALSSHAGGTTHKNLAAAARNTPSVFGQFQTRNVAQAEPVIESTVNDNVLPEGTVQPEPSSVPSVQPGSSNVIPFGPTRPSRTDITTYFGGSAENKNIARAEILWTLHTVKTNNSFSSNYKISELFSAMFQDSAIAKGFKMSETKTKYILDFGLKPNFLNLLTKKVQQNSVCKYFVVCFDETMNENLQMKQLDFYVRYWDSDTVLTRYIHSEFLGKARATDLVECLESR